MKTTKHCLQCVIELFQLCVDTCMQLHRFAQHSFANHALDLGHSRTVNPRSPQVFVNGTKPTPPFAPPPAPPGPPPPISNSYDLTHFETVLLPKWVAQYALPTNGQFSFHPNGRMPHPYATSDVAHVLCFTGQLGNLTNEDRTAWAAVINSFQREDGFYDNTDAAGVSGGSLWHAAGYVPAGLSLLGQAPLRRNIMFDTIAATKALWEPTISALLERDERHSIPNNISSGCGSGYDCAQNIASLMSWQIMTNASFGGLSIYADFVEWCVLAFAVTPTRPPARTCPTMTRQPSLCPCHLATPRCCHSRACVSDDREHQQLTFATVGAVLALDGHSITSYSHTVTVTHTHTHPCALHRCTVI
jgi:hypothetical protein